MTQTDGRLRHARPAAAAASPNDFIDPEHDRRLLSVYICLKSGTDLHEMLERSTHLKWKKFDWKL